LQEGVRLEIAGTFFQEVIALVGYALMFAAVYKLFQMSTDLGEIKELLKRRNSLPITPLPSASIPATAPSSAIASNFTAPLPTSVQPSSDFADGESATAYAEQLMRAIQSQSNSPSNPESGNWQSR
jgi:hypothetical protein